MQPELKLVLDRGCETYSMLKHWAVDEFWEIQNHTVNKDAIYVVGRNNFASNKQHWIDLINQDLKVVFSNPFEGSDTIRLQLLAHGIEDLLYRKKMLMIGGGDMDPAWPCLTYDHFLSKFHDFDENINECARTQEIYSKTQKPYKFLFLNGRGRPHRKWMIEYLDSVGALDSSIWSWLDPSSRASRDLQLIANGNNLMNNPRDLHLLSPQYEVGRYRSNLNIPSESIFAKYELFNKEWGEIYINANAYIDTYFSVVTETVFNYPYSFRTEKIWKPIAIGHPWIAVANQWFYRDMHNLGFQTFGHLIDESFDSIENNQTRIERIGQVIDDLCKQNLSEFLDAAQGVCKYNQSHMLEIREPTRQAFPNRFHQFLKEHQWTT